jgi:hypothetical protein
MVYSDTGINQKTIILKPVPEQIYLLYLTRKNDNTANPYVSRLAGPHPDCCPCGTSLGTDYEYHAKYNGD